MLCRSLWWLPPSLSLFWSTSRPLPWAQLRLRKDIRGKQTCVWAIRRSPAPLESRERRVPTGQWRISDGLRRIGSLQPLRERNASGIIIIFILRYNYWWAIIYNRIMKSCIALVCAWVWHVCVCGYWMQLLKFKKSKVAPFILLSCLVCACVCGGAMTYFVTLRCGNSLDWLTVCAVCKASVTCMAFSIQSAS